jgi:type II secretory pathway pseudopilin PulG
VSHYAQKKMSRANVKSCSRPAVTLMELVIAMAMIGIIFAAILPQFALIRNSWDVKQGTAEALQNGRVLMDHINRNLSKAVRITAVSASSDTDGYIEFEDNDSNTLRYDIAANNYVEYGVVVNLADLAGPVSSLTFTCYDACDLDTALSPVTDTNDVRVVKVNAAFTNSGSMGQDKTFTTWVYLRVNAQSRVCWENHDIGAVAATGSATFADCNWTVVGSGVDIWDNTDEFHYVYQSLNGDGQIVARVVSMTNTDPWAKAGVMIRETLTGGSKHAMMVVTPGSGNAFQRRLSTDGVSTHTAGSAVTAPYWVKLIRSGNTFTGFESSNGSTWTRVDSDTVTMSSSVYIGPAVTSHNDGVLCTANFDNVSFLTYNDFNEAKTSSDTTTLPILTPVTNTGDLLIAAVATDGDTSGSLAPAIPANWTAINVGVWSGQVTLGAWRRFATASEPASHTFTWTGNRGAYGWIMRFKGHDPSNPINALQTNGQTHITPTSPAVPTTVDGCLILRLGAFDDDYITTDAPGLAGHSPITMDKNAATATVAFVAAGAVASNGAAITPALPAGIVTGDILLLFLETSNQAISISNQNGGTWTAVTNSPQSTGTAAGSTGARLTAFWSRYNGTQGAPTTSDSGNHQLGRIVAIRGAAASGDPWDVTAGGVEAAADTSGSIPGATTTVANTLVVAAIATALPDATGTANFSAWTNGNLTSITERTDNTVNAGNGGGLGIATGTKATAGAYGNTAVTCASASYKAMMSIALRPSGTVSGGAGYVRQATTGSSGTSTFSLTASSEAQMLTIAIAPDITKGEVCCGGTVRP